jgi:hypothetical protein
VQQAHGATASHAPGAAPERRRPRAAPRPAPTSGRFAAARPVRFLGLSTARGLPADERAPRPGATKRRCRRVERVEEQYAGARSPASYS